MKRVLLAEVTKDGQVEVDLGPLTENFSYRCTLSYHYTITRSYTSNQDHFLITIISIHWIVFTSVQTDLELFGSFSSFQSRFFFVRFMTALTSPGLDQEVWFPRSWRLCFCLILLSILHVQMRLEIQQRFRMRFSNALTIWRQSEDWIANST